MFQVSRSESMKTGVAPRYVTTFAVAAKVKVDTRTSSPGRRPASDSARCRAAVPLERAAAWGTPTVSQNSRSNASTWGPSGAIQFESKASSSNSRSAGPMCGGER